MKEPKSTDEAGRALVITLEKLAKAKMPDAIPSNSEESWVEGFVYGYSEKFEEALSSGPSEDPYSNLQNYEEEPYEFLLEQERDSYKKLAEQWQADYDRLKAKHEPLVAITSNTPKLDEKELEDAAQADDLCNTETMETFKRGARWAWGRK